jgi:uncharacterized protein CbrC (UPF0167 family)
MIVHEEFALAGQALNSAYNYDVLCQVCENVPRFHHEFWQLKIWLLHHGSAQSHTSFFTREFFMKSNVLPLVTLLGFPD